MYAFLVSAGASTPGAARAAFLLVEDGFPARVRLGRNILIGVCEGALDGDFRRVVPVEEGRVDFHAGNPPARRAQPDHDPVGGRGLWRRVSHPSYHAPECTNTPGRLMGGVLVSRLDAAANHSSLKDTILEPSGAEMRSVVW